MTDSLLQIDPASGDPDTFDLYVIMVHIPMMQELIETDQ